MDDLPRCKICGDTVPAGKELCWCCDRKDKLHKIDEPKKEDTTEGEKDR